MPVDVRRRVVLLALLSVAAVPVPARAQRAEPEVEVYKSSTCGCCRDWIRHLEADGFRVRVFDVADPSIYRAALGMPQRYGSCHTARVGGYVIEGHVPAREIRRLLREKPNALGIAVPGMPIGSPGMDGPEYRGQVDRYDVLLVQPSGHATVFAAYAPGKR
jgi:hypothetical protein